MGICSSDETKELKSTANNFKKIPRFYPCPRRGFCVSIYDGDTLTIVSKEYGKLQRFNIRVKGIDCAEMKGGSALSRALAVKAKQVTTALCLNKMVTLKNHGHDKYGRVLADVFVNGISIGKRLVYLNLAKAYNGKKKISFE